MRRLTTGIFRELLNEIRYWRFSRWMYVLVAVVATGACLSFVAATSYAQAAHEQFLRSVATHEANGTTLAEALAAPTTVTREGDAETIDNPLKHDFLQLAQAVHVVKGSGPAVSAALDFVTFLVIPLAFLIVGATSATYDRRFGTMKLRAARARWGHISAAKLLSIVVLAVLAVFAVVVSAAAVSLLGRAWAADMLTAVDYPLPPPESSSPWVVKLAMTA